MIITIHTWSYLDKYDELFVYQPNTEAAIYK
jgi:hypothetical protein